ncbi:MAG TPA: AraC family transcriptional regulator [Nevskia sp.]|nr:AraC family transcriptional regulator [Nevskia sp.]
MAAEGEDLVGRVRAELALRENGYPDLAGVAARLSMSDRTLKRRLQRSGTSYQALRDEACRRDALRLLENPNLEIRQIASALGYGDPPSFTRAFLRWTGESPSAARRRLRA